MVKIEKIRKDENSAAKYEEASEKMEAVIWKHGWDGEWFKRAYDDAGKPVGSSDCIEGKIFIEPQGICIMAGWDWRMGKPGRHWILLMNTWQRTMGLFYSSQPTVGTTLIWARSRHTLLDIKRTLAFSVILTPGS